MTLALTPADFLDTTEALRKVEAAINEGGALPDGGSPGQLLVNSAPGVAAWANVAQAAPGESLVLVGGADDGSGGQTAALVGGDSTTSGIAGGQAVLVGGNAQTGDADGGSVRIAGGSGHGAGKDGPVLFPGLPTSDPHIEGACWWNSNVLTRSAG